VKFRSAAQQTMPTLGRATVGVMGSGSAEHRELAEPLGQLLARLGVNLLTGAGGGVSSRGQDDLSRNHINVLSCAAIVALPGAEGTAAEVALAVRYGKPVVIFCEDPSQVATFHGDVARLTEITRVEEFLRGAI
jgi:predicted Rossmann-fold nucleotide-binding protein